MPVIPCIYNVSILLTFYVFALFFVHYIFVFSSKRNWQETRTRAPEKSPSKCLRLRRCRGSLVAHHRNGFVDRDELRLEKHAFKYITHRIHVWYIFMANVRRLGKYTKYTIHGFYGSWYIIIQEALIMFEDGAIHNTYSLNPWIFAYDSKLPRCYKKTISGNTSRIASILP